MVANETDVDTLIIRCIEREYKSCGEIATELEVSERIIYRRMCRLRRCALVTYIKSSERRGTKTGFPPTLYKKRGK